MLSHAMIFSCPQGSCIAVPSFDVYGDTTGIVAAKAEMGQLLSEELLEAASYGRFQVYNDPPPEKKKSSPVVPKDKMQAAREYKARKDFFADPAVSRMINQNSPKAKEHGIRAGP